MISIHKKIQPAISTALGVLLMVSYISGANVYAAGEKTIAQSGSKEKASQGCKNNYSLISYNLRPRSVPKFIMALEDDLAIDAEQKKQLKKITQHVRKDVLPMRQKVKNFEKTLIIGFVEDGKTPGDLSAQLDKLAQLKREVAIEEIKVFNQLKKILTAKQYQTAIKDTGWAP